ncbi:MAG: hypothetical protein P4L98_10005 [Ancalomicrobiaceae bacterium]|nr:hypothetical protein [Ancalomicrobiaceae bacterium]
MRALDEDRDIDRLLHMQRRIDAEVRQRFSTSEIAGRALEPDERRQAQALIADLAYIIGELGRQRDLARLAMAAARQNTSASLTYLGVGRMVRQPRRVFRA